MVLLTAFADLGEACKAPNNGTDLVSAPFPSLPRLRSPAISWDGLM